MRATRTAETLVAIAAIVGALTILFVASRPIATAQTDLVVSTLSDSGTGSLRQAMLTATSGAVITFDPKVFPANNPVAIAVKSALPTISRSNVTIDASNAGVIIDGAQAPAGTNGFVIAADAITIRGLTIRKFAANGIFISPGSSGNTIGGARNIGNGPHGRGNLIILNGSNGIEIRGSGATNNVVAGNYVGISSSGTVGQGNSLNGIAIWQGASGNSVGGLNGNLRNVISGNEDNGVWIAGAGSNQNRIIGNYIGTNHSGMGPVPNGLSGVSIQDGAQNNSVGEAAAGAANLISGNLDNGIFMGGDGTNGNGVLGNIIGPNREGTGYVGQGANGVTITSGASGNFVGNGTIAGRNLISRNAFHGVLVEHSSTQNNVIKGNLIGTNIFGDAALPNLLHGIALAEGSHHTIVGGNRNIGDSPLGEGNVLSGNGNHGLVITSGSHNNIVTGNLIGPDITGTRSLGNQVSGGVDIAEGASSNRIGGTGAGESNVISGNQLDGIALFDNTGAGTTDNEIIGNLIGLTLDGSAALPNLGPGIFHVLGSSGTVIKANVVSGNATHGVQLSGNTSSGVTLQNNLIGTDAQGAAAVPNGGSGIFLSELTHDNEIGLGNVVAHNLRYGIHMDSCVNNLITSVSIYGNGLEGIRSNCLSPLTLTAATTERVEGTTVAGARVEIYSDDDDEGRYYEGTVNADASGRFAYSKTGGFLGPNITAISSSSDGRTSQFSRPVHIAWTILIYLNGDNDLESFFEEAFEGMVAAGPSPRANVFVLFDKSGNSDTTLYDLTYDVSEVSAEFIQNGELNMGDGQSLVAFANWARGRYPAKHTMLSIVDHGGGWAPSAAAIPPGALPIREHAWQAGNSGLSWDFTGDNEDYDYIDSAELRNALEEIRVAGGALDVVFLDVCLMGLTEVAYQISDQASFLVASQNIGWAPLGSDDPEAPAAGRYVHIVNELAPNATPQQMAQLLVESYAQALPSDRHPFTIAAIDLRMLPTLASNVDQLATAILAQLPESDLAVSALYQTYLSSQKIDYDSDLKIETATDGFVDLYDFALKAKQNFNSPAIINAAQSVQDTVDAAVVAEQHKSGAPWMLPDHVWNLNRSHGLSIFFPLGEDLEFPITITETIAPGKVITRNLRLRDMYTADQLRFVADTNWDSLIDGYYDVISPTVASTSGPIDGLLEPDVSPPQTSITLEGDVSVGSTVTIHWTTLELQSGISEVTLWHKSSHGSWEQTGAVSSRQSGSFEFTLLESCSNAFSVRGTDIAGNVETFVGAANFEIVDVPYCIRMPNVRGGG